MRGGGSWMLLGVLAERATRSAIALRNGEDDRRTKRIVGMAMGR